MASQQAWHDAARRGDFDGLRRLLRANPSLALARDAAGRTALHHLAALPSSAGAAEACAALCSSAGANATSLLEAANDNGQSAMHRAVLSGSRDVALALLAAGADPHARTAKERRSPLEVCRDAALRDELEAAAAAARMRRSAAAQTPLAAARQASGGAAPTFPHAATVTHHAAPAEAPPAAPAPAAADDAVHHAVAPPPPPPPLDAEQEAWETRDGPLSADEAAAAWDRAASALSADGMFDRALAARLVARNVPPPAPLRAPLWAAAAGVAPLRAALHRRGVRFATLAAGGSACLRVATALAALSGHHQGSMADHASVDGLVALCLEVTCADEEAAFWLCLALRARLAPADAAAVAVHAARRRPDLCCALGARGRGHTVDYLLYTGVWRSAPAMVALEAPLCRWLGSGFASMPDAMHTPQLLRAWDEALLGAAAPAETMARLAAARIAARADAAVAAAAGAPAESDARGAAIAKLVHHAEPDDDDDVAFDALLAAARAMQWAEPPPPPPDAPKQPPPRAEQGRAPASETEAEAYAALEVHAMAVSAPLAALRAEAAAAGAPAAASHGALELDARFFAALQLG
jgi:hypothetical protein